MTSKILRLAAAALAFCALNAVARGVEPIESFDNMPVLSSTGQPASMPQIQAAAIAAGAAHGWQVTPIAGSRLAATMNVRGKHMIMTEIELAPGQFSVKYKDSVNMKYEAGGMIHPSYNKWVHQLSDGIRMEAARL